MPASFDTHPSGWDGVEAGLRYLRWCLVFLSYTLTHANSDRFQFVFIQALLVFRIYRRVRPGLPRLIG